MSLQPVDRINYGHDILAVFSDRRRAVLTQLR
jgi:hypothetical protein